MRFICRFCSALKCFGNYVWFSVGSAFGSSDLHAGSSRSTEMDFVKIFEDTVRDLKREVDKVVLKVPEIELKVLDATNHEPWGPHGSALVELAQATKNYNECQMIMNVLWKRLAETGKNWRHVYKALTVLEYLVAHGAERVIEDINEHSYQLSGLLEFEYVEPNGKDQGINVRKKSQNLIALIRDKDKIQEVRQKAVANRNKYCGLSSTGGYKPSSYSGIAGGYSSYDDDFGGPFRKSEEDNDKFKTDKYGEKYNEKSSDGKSIGNTSSDQFVDDDDFAKLRDHGDVKYSSMHDHNNIDAYSPRVESSVPYSKDETPIKPSIGSASVYTDDDFDDFDPRGTSTAGVGAGASADTTDDDLFGSFSSNPAAGPTNNTTLTTSATFTGQIPPPPSATNSFVPTSITPPASATKSISTTSNSQEMDFFSTATAPTTASSANSSLIGVTVDANSDVDLFAGATFVEAPPAASTDSLNQINDDLLSQDFLTGQASASNVSGNVNLFDGDFIDAIGTTSSTENQAFEAEKPNLTTTTKAEPAKDKFQPKSSIWADSLSRGLVDLNLSEPKRVSLADIGIVLDTSTPPKKDLESRPSFTMRMGKAMGSGSGRGRLGGSTLSANSSSSVESTGTALGMNPLTNLFESKQETPATMASGPAMNFPLNFPTGSGQTGLNNQSQNFGRFS